MGANVVWELVAAASLLLRIKTDNGDPVLGIGAEKLLSTTMSAVTGKDLDFKAFRSRHQSNNGAQRVGDKRDELQ